MSLLKLENARHEEQRQLMERLLRQNGCPFCPENVSLPALRPVLHQGKFWHVRENNWPYENTRVHLLLIHNQHIEHLSQLVVGEMDELFAFARWAENEYGVRGGALCMRFGDLEFNAGTIKHLHLHFIAIDVIDQKDRNYQPVRFKIG